MYQVSRLEAISREHVTVNAVREDPGSGPVYYEKAHTG